MCIRDSPWTHLRRLSPVCQHSIPHIYKNAERGCLLRLSTGTPSLRTKQVPFSIEVGGVWGLAARRFFDGCLATANDARDVDFYHWSSQSFGEFWKDALSVLMARERARIGLAASEGDLSRRIVAYAYDDQEDSAADT